MIDPSGILISDYNYTLPPGQIAQFPVDQRDASRLLIFRDGILSEDIFSSVGKYLPANSHLVFNNTRVVRARLIFKKPTGGEVEIFCLEPISPTTEIQKAFTQHEICEWKCLVGNSKRWKSGTLKKERTLGEHRFILEAERIMNLDDGCSLIRFQWTPEHSDFAEILEMMGQIPLPPYINRDSDSADNDRYQTIYAHHEGSVAAPTAGLHFTESLLNNISARGITTSNVTLHVGIGTFRPVSTDHIGDHVMHPERIIVSRQTIEKLINHSSQPVIAVGTTSARTLESLYWLGRQILLTGESDPMVVHQWQPYQPNQDLAVSCTEALQALFNYLTDKDLNDLHAETRLIIVPGYRFQLVSGLITNFHMPQSTLLLMVAALVGAEWKKAYSFALEKGFRFLSYGDACLFF